MNETPCRLVYVTAADREEALRIGRAVVEARLAACVNVVDGMSALYHWAGKIETGTESILLAKTTAARLPALMSAIRQHHSYDCPCIVALPLVDGDADYLAWIAREVEPRDPPPP